MSEMRKYTFTHRAGITDLRGFLGDMATEWWTDKEWDEWRAGATEREEWNKNYIQELKDKGDYGKEYEQSISLVHHPLFDDLQFNKPVLTSNIFFLDISKPTDHDKDKD